MSDRQCHRSLAIQYPADGWVEQDPMAIWESQRLAMSRLEQSLTPEQRSAVVACGITNQRETTILWRRSDGQPCGPALVWQDGRTAALCDRWKQEGLEQEWRARTGLLLDPYFSASKIHWLIQHESAAREAVNQDDLCFGTVESWLLWHLSGATRHCSDMSNASRTLLMDLKRRAWVEPFCEQAQLPASALPTLVPCRGDFGDRVRDCRSLVCPSARFWVISRPPPSGSYALNLAKPNALTAPVPSWW